MLSFILVDVVALVNKLAEELFTAAVTDIRVLAGGRADGGVWWTLDVDGVGQTEEHGASMFTAQCCRNHTLFEKKATG